MGSVSPITLTSPTYLATPTSITDSAPNYRDVPANEWVNNVYYVSIYFVDSDLTYVQSSDYTITNMVPAYDGGFNEDYPIEYYMDGDGYVDMTMGDSDASIFSKPFSYSGATTAGLCLSSKSKFNRP